MSELPIPEGEHLRAPCFLEMFGLAGRSPSRRSLHPDRAAGGHRHHRPPGRVATAALAKSKAKAEAVTCANNLQQLSLAWALYAGTMAIGW